MSHEYDLTITIQSPSRKVQENVIKKLVPEEYLGKTLEKADLEKHEVFCVGYTLTHLDVELKIKSGDKFYKIAQHILSVLGDEKFRQSVISCSSYCHIYLTFQNLIVFIDGKGKLRYGYTYDYTPGFRCHCLKEMVDKVGGEELAWWSEVPEPHVGRHLKGYKEVVVRTFS